MGWTGCKSHRTRTSLALNPKVLLSLARAEQIGQFTVYRPNLHASWWVDRACTWRARVQWQTRKLAK